MRILILICCIAASSTVQAQHALQAKDWELDKNNHFASGVALGAFDWKLGCGAGALKEFSDKKADARDFLYTCAGSGLSHWLGKDKSKLYKYNVVVIILDGLSTDNGIRQGGFEVGVPKRVIGHIPSTAKIAAWTGFRLWLLKKSEGWDKDFKSGFQWGTAVLGTGVVYMNYQVKFK